MLRLPRLQTTGLTRLALMVALVALGEISRAEDNPELRQQLLQLQQQNQKLQTQLEQQQRLIDSLAHKVDDISQAQEQQARVTNAAPADSSAAPSELQQIETSALVHIGKVNINGEGGLAIFWGQNNSSTPHPTFRIDEARLFLETPVWQDTYFFTELDLATRETTSLGLNVGELYLDFEDLSRLWGREGMFNVRAGRFYIPFGEEYLNRFAIDNPLISHSVSDLWGNDDGIETYGKLGPVQYVAAVQNGGSGTSRALQNDKSVSGRLSYDPASWLHLSGSAMRTGNLNVNNGFSAMWFGNGFFRPLGGAGTTTFHANLVEGDLQVHLGDATFRAFGGFVDYNDNNPSGGDHRQVYYYSAEGIYNFTHDFYGAARFSEAFAPNGFPIVGNGTTADYLFTDLTTEYWRLSLGLGYRLGPNLLVKGEYSFTQGSEVDGTVRSGENVVSAEAAFKF